MASRANPESDSLSTHAGFTFHPSCGPGQCSHLQSADAGSAHAGECKSLFPWVVFGKVSAQEAQGKVTVGLQL